MSSTSTQVLFESSSARAECESCPEGLLIRLSGVIDERFDWTGMKGILASGKALRFDLHGVRRLNSTGVKGWVLFMKEAPANLDVTYVDVSEIVIEQFGLVPTMLGGKEARIESFRLPYRCESCRLDFSITAKTSELRSEAGGYSAPVAACPKCGRDASFDLVEEEYFAFVKWGSAVQR